MPVLVPLGFPSFFPLSGFSQVNLLSLQSRSLPLRVPLRSLHCSSPSLRPVRSSHWGGSPHSSRLRSLSGVLSLIPLSGVSLQVASLSRCLVLSWDPLLTRFSRSPPCPALPIPLWVLSFTRRPSGSPLFTPPSLSGSLPHSPSRSLQVPRCTGRTASNSAPGMFAAAAPGPSSGTPAVTLAPALSPQRCHPRLRRLRLLSLVLRVALVLLVPTRSLRQRVRVAPHSPRRTLGCRRRCCPRCGSARGGQSHPTARSAPRPHSTPPLTPPTAVL